MTVRSGQPEARPLIHIGYHKTGTNWLQGILFQAEDAGFTAPFTKRKVKGRIALPNALDFDAVACRRLFESGLLEAAERGLVPVLSAERLSGNPSTGGYDSRDLANRLHEVFPSGRVLIVIREQKSMIASAYKNYVNRGGASPLERYIFPPRKIELPHFEFQHFEYDRLTAHYMNLFGRDSVLVLPYELLLADPSELVSRVVDFAGAAPQPGALDRFPYGEKANPAVSALVASMIRRVNATISGDRLGRLVPLVPGRRWPGLAERLVRRTNARLRKVDRRLPQALKRRSDASLEAKVAAAVAGRYAESNRRSQRLIGIDLREYGYEVAPEETASPTRDDRPEPRTATLSPT